MSRVIEILEGLKTYSPPDRMLDFMIGDLIGHPSFDLSSTNFPPFMPLSKAGLAVPTYTTSTDAAFDLFAQVLPDYHCSLADMGVDGWVFECGPRADRPTTIYVGKTRPLAIIGGTLNAKIIAAVSGD